MQRVQHKLPHSPSTVPANTTENLFFNIIQTNIEKQLVLVSIIYNYKHYVLKTIFIIYWTTYNAINQSTKATAKPSEIPCWLKWDPIFSRPATILLQNLFLLCYKKYLIRYKNSCSNKCTHLLCTAIWFTAMVNKTTQIPFGACIYYLQTQPFLLMLVIWNRDIS